MPYIATDGKDAMFVLGRGSTKEAAAKDARLNNHTEFSVYKCTKGVYDYTKHVKIIIDTTIKYQAGRFTLR